MFLTTHDFGIDSNRNLIKKNENGFSFIFFFTPECKMCRGLKPIFENLKNKIRGVKFEYMDVAQDNLKLHKMSLESNNPITSVPSFFLFHNGIKIAEYIRDKKLNENLEKMNNFLIINIRENKNNFKVNQTNYGGAIPYNMASRPLYLIVE